MGKIGILTFHRPPNDGSALQALSVFKIIRSLFKDREVEVIDYVPGRSLLAKMRRGRSFLSVRNPRAGYNGFLSASKKRNFVEGNLVLSKEHIETSDYREAVGKLRGRYELIFVGSDTVWECINDGYAPPIPNIYWLPEPMNCKKIAFAASANRTNVESITSGQRALLAGSLRSFDLIGVRDEVTYDFALALLDGDAGKLLRVPDPTFLLEIEKTSVASILEKCGIDLGRPVLGISLSDKAVFKGLADRYRAKGYQILDLLYQNPYADATVTGKVNPMEWAGMYKHLTFCITDRFHGTVFSLKNLTPFMTVDWNPSYVHSVSKTRSLLKDFDLMDHHLNFFDFHNDIESIVRKAEDCEGQYNSLKVQAGLDLMTKKLRDFCSRISTAIG